MTFNKSYINSPSSFIMDETLEVVPKDKEEIKLDILKPYKDGDDIMLKDDVSLGALVSEREIAVLEAMAIDLDDIKNTITKRGMSQGIALEMQRYCPDIINDDRPKGYFTINPSSTGSNIALEAIYDSKKTLMENFKAMIAKIMAWLSAKYDFFKDKILSLKDALITRSKVVNKQSGSIDIGRDLKQAAVKLVKNDEELEAVKKFDESVYVKDVIANYFKVRNSGDSLKNVVIIYHCKKINHYLKDLYFKYSSQPFSEEAVKSGAFSSIMDDMHTTVNNAEALLNDITFLDKGGSSELFHKLKDAVYTYDYAVTGSLPIIIKQYLKDVSNYKTESSEELNQITKWTQCLVKMMEFNKIVIIASVDFNSFYTEYIDPSSPKAVDIFYQSAIKANSK